MHTSHYRLCHAITKRDKILTTFPRRHDVHDYDHFGVESSVAVTQLCIVLAVLAIGVTKEALEVGEISRDLEIIHSVLETLVTVSQVRRIGYTQSCFQI